MRSRWPGAGYAGERLSVQIAAGLSPGGKEARGLAAASQLLTIWALPPPNLVPR